MVYGTIPPLKRLSLTLVKSLLRLLRPPATLPLAPTRVLYKAHAAASLRSVAVFQL